MLLGIDIGTSSVKVSLLDIHTRECKASATYPDSEAKIISLKTGWAEQSPEEWWLFTKKAIHKLAAKHNGKLSDIAAIGIAYQMHGLVLVDKDRKVLRNSIIWCDSRAVTYGEAAFEKIGKENCLSCLLNSPGNFTAAKLAWVKENEPAIYNSIDKIMLPGDFIAMKLTGEITTTISALSEGIFWDFKNNSLSSPLINYFGFDISYFPGIRNVFADHGKVSVQAAGFLGIPSGIPITYKAGDQPNNAFSLNVLKPGEVAANAGTSGVIYGLSDQNVFDNQSRINSFAHVNHSKTDPRIGVLLCINGAGITSSWIRSMMAKDESYDALNLKASTIPAGSEGLSLLPFGNGAERILNNVVPGAQFLGIDFNKHSNIHFYRAGLEGVACAFRYGLDIMRENGIVPTVIRAGYANMFLSEVFTEAFVNTTGVPVELYKTDGSCGAALGAGIGAGSYSFKEAFDTFHPVKRVESTIKSEYNDIYEKWKNQLMVSINAK